MWCNLHQQHLCASDSEIIASLHFSVLCLQNEILCIFNGWRKSILLLHSICKLIAVNVHVLCCRNRYLSDNIYLIIYFCSFSFHFHQQKRFKWCQSLNNNLGVALDENNDVMAEANEIKRKKKIGGKNVYRENAKAKYIAKVKVK